MSTSGDKRHKSFSEEEWSDFRAYQKSKKRKSWLILGAVAALLLVAIFAQVDLKTLMFWSDAAGRDGEVVHELMGTKTTSFGTTSQARELYDLILKNPGKEIYSLKFATDDAFVTLAADFGKDILSRKRVRAGGSGTVERWDGYLMDRIKAAMAGSSFNDTPEGKRFGDMEKL